MATSDPHIPNVGPIPDERTPCVPDPLPDFEWVSFIGAGGFGDVWLARERVTGVLRAVKVLSKRTETRAAREIDGVKRYQHCAHNHPHLLQILLVGETERMFFYVMELADNAHADAAAGYVPMTLRDTMKSGRPLPPAAALVLLAKLLSGVQRLHGQDLAHYDLKPENILIVRGEPKIADVGLVDAIQAVAPRAGTAAYMSGEGADDVYALGKILYELITGRAATAFPRLPPELLRARRTGPTRAAIRILNRACDPDPARRFQTVAAFAHALDRHLPGASRDRASARRRKLAWLATVAALCALGAWAIWHGDDGPRADGKARVVHERHLGSDAAQWELVAQPISVSDGRVAQTFVAGQRLPNAGQYAIALPELPDTGCFAVDWHIGSIRPWGRTSLGITSDRDGSFGLWIHLIGQPEGLGLSTTMCCVDRYGASAMFPLGSPRSGHPLPGVEYVLRAAFMNGTCTLALWPLNIASPLAMHTSEETPLEIHPRYLNLFTQCTNRNDRVDLYGVRVAAYASPIRAHAEDIPQEVRLATQSGAKPALVPPLLGLTPPGGENILLPPWSPRDSGTWSAVGSWSWWPNFAEGHPDQRVRCRPWSTGQRHANPDPNNYAGLQMLRFDGCAYGDFEAELVFSLAGGGDEPDPWNPFPCASHDGVVALAFRMQDVPDAGDLWGDACLVRLSVPYDRTRSPTLALHRTEGLKLGQDAFAVVRTTARGVDGVHVLERDEIMPPRRVTLRVRAEGPRTTIDLNGLQVIDATNPDANGPRVGRLGIQAERLMVSFESLTVRPLGTDE